MEKRGDINPRYTPDLAPDCVVDVTAGRGDAPPPPAGVEKLASQGVGRRVEDAARLAATPIRPAQD